MPVASPDVGRRPAAAGSLQVGDESVPGVVGGQGLLGRIDVGLDGVGQDRIQQRHAAGEVAVRGAGAAPARRAICSSGAFRPWSQNTCRAAPGWRGGCAGRRGERPGGWWAVCARHTAGGTGNSEGCLRIVLADRANRRITAGAGGASRPGVPYELSDPFILVHESRFRLSELSGMDTKHPDRGFDNLWYILEGSASTGHSTGPGGAIERARLPKGALLALRTGRGAWHAEAIGAEERGEGLGDTEWRSVLFWVNLARKDKQAEPSAQVLLPEQVSVRREGDATVRVLVGEGSPVHLGTPALILDVELPEGGQVTMPVPPGFQGFAYVLDGEAAFGANRRRARAAQLVVLGAGAEFAVTDAAPGTRFLLMTGQPYGEVPVFNGPFVD